MKKIYGFSLSLLITSSFITNNINAQENINQVPKPYRLIQHVQEKAIDKDYCLNFFNQKRENVYQDNQASSEIETLETEITNLANQHNEITLAIEDLEQNPDYSRQAAQAGLDHTLETVYDELSQEQTGFLELDASSQEKYLVQDSRVQEWQTYLSEVQAEIDYLVHQQKLIEDDYNQALYRLEELESQSSYINQEQSENNACELYAYSVPFKLDEQIIFDTNNGSLEDILVNLDQIMQALVPKAYSKVSFQQIYEIFNLFMSQEELDKILKGKELIRLDQNAYHEYSYARELSLSDIENLAHFAQRYYLDDQDDHRYNQAYHEIIQLKEDQFHYFFQINREVFIKIQEILLKYLNANNLDQEKSLQAIQTFQSKYQIKLVFYDDQTSHWVANDFKSTGFYDEYINRVIEGKVITNEQSSSADHSSTQENPQEINDDKSSNKRSVRNQQLQAIKDKLSSHEANKPSKAKTLAGSNNNKAKKSPKKEDKSASKSSLKLPDTGESRAAYLIAITFVVIGVIILIPDLIQRYRHKKNIEHLHLD
ncbi:hypothetical protein [Eremococcus coleocola]|uniref:hypothetical protein n=1 Tax=Eremococcus coleocola TaxID=88132 RepID=UPI000405C994|nr:hypothetical protein [Eremococcus coleocola]